MQALVPKQENNYDCGPWILETARCIMLKKPINFSQADLQNIKKRQKHEHGTHKKEKKTLVISSCPSLESASTIQIISIAWRSICRKVIQQDSCHIKNKMIHTKLLRIILNPFCRHNPSQSQTLRPLHKRHPHLKQQQINHIKQKPRKEYTRNNTNVQEP